MPYLSLNGPEIGEGQPVSIRLVSGNRTIVNTYSNAALIYGNGQGELHCYINDQIAYIAKGNFDFGTLEGEGELIEYISLNQISVTQGIFEHSQVIERTFFQIYDLSA